MFGPVGGDVTVYSAAGSCRQDPVYHIRLLPLGPRGGVGKPL